MALIACLGWSFAAAAEDYPARIVTIIVPCPPGGPTDTLARSLVPIMSEKLGQNIIIIENVSCGATDIGTGRVANAAPDGYTLLLHNLQISTNVSLYPKLHFDIEKSLVPVVFINSNPLLLVGRKTLAANSFAELTTWMKTTPPKLGNPGSGSTGHLAISLFARALGAPIDQIAYRGAAPMFQDVLGGFIDLTFATPQQVIEPIRAGLVAAYAVTAKRPMTQVPQAERMVAACGPQLEIPYWHALFAPAGTPDAIVAKINAVVSEAMKDSMIVKTWAEAGMTAYPEAQRTPQAARALMHSEVERWGEVVRKNGINASNQPPSLPAAALGLTSGPAKGFSPAPAQARAEIP